MIIIKRYPNRKLYNTEAKQYITLKGVGDLIRDGNDVQVIDHASGEDLTALTLTQIILEQEKEQSGLLSNSLLTSLIQAGTDRISSLQRSLGTSLNFWRQVDEEIKQRVQGLVHQGELTALEGEKLVERLLLQGAHRREESSLKGSGAKVTEQDIDAYLAQRQVPTQEDLKRLYDQLDELSSKLDNIGSD